MHPVSSAMLFLQPVFCLSHFSRLQHSAPAFTPVASPASAGRIHKQPAREPEIWRVLCRTNCNTGPGASTSPAVHISGLQRGRGGGGAVTQPDEPCSKGRGLKGTQPVLRAEDPCDGRLPHNTHQKEQLANTFADDMSTTCTDAPIPTLCPPPPPAALPCPPGLCSVGGGGVRAGS